MIPQGKMLPKLINGTSNDHQFHALLNTINRTGPGSFSGYIIAKKGDKDIISIPVTFSSEPLFWEPIILVIIGVCISVCIWEIILQYRDSQKESDTKKKEQSSIKARRAASKAKKVALKYSTEVKELDYLASEGLVQPFDLVRAPIAKHTADFLSKDAEAKNEKALILQGQIEKNEVSLNKRQKKNKAPVQSAVRIALLELVPSLFGIFIAMFAVLNQEIVVGTTVLSSLLVAKLIGIGLATGSLKQLVDK